MQENGVDQEGPTVERVYRRSISQRTLRNRTFDGALVRVIRKGKGLRLEPVAGAVGVSVSHLSRIERGERLPTAVVAVALADVLGVPLDTISSRLGAHDYPRAS